jgi:hypothetical protein
MRKVAAGAIALTIGLMAGITTASSFSLTSGDENDRRLNGVRDIGADISDVDHTLASVRAYLNSLSPEGQRGVLGGCETALANLAQVNSPDLVIPFCELATGSVIPVGSPG